MFTPFPPSLLVTPAISLQNQHAKKHVTHLNVIPLAIADQVVERCDIATATVAAKQVAITVTTERFAAAAFSRDNRERVPAVVFFPRSIPAIESEVLGEGSRQIVDGRSPTKYEKRYQQHNVQL